jgi:phosphatidylserine/phosphatidylglycerophosphate/cardiolipin synthase-like enzyme
MRLLSAFGLSLVLAACGPADPVEEIDDPEEEGVFSEGKADAYGFSSCTAAAIVAYLNQSTTGYDALRALGISKSAAKNIAAHRDGADATPGTADDDPFDDLYELDKVRWVGSAVMKRIAAEKSVADACRAATVEVIFSPQPYASSHLARVVQLIDGAQHSIDVAMYNLSDSGATQALGRAAARGVKVRFINEEGAVDAKSPQGSKSLALEQLGVNVRYVTKIMHHKVMIVDGPRDDVARAASARLVSGSANWSNGAATRYDENTLFVAGSPRLALRYQAEFNLLWEHSKDFVGDATLPYEQGIALEAASFPADAAADCVFTSDNFTAAAGSTTFKQVVGKNTIADLLVKEIAGAQSSIHIASGHLRSRPVSEALIAAKAARPGLDIKVYLDGQEYISASAHADQVAELKSCVAAAGGDPAKEQACKDKGFLFSYQVSEAGVALRYKYYAYRWDYSYAKQMHNKYFIIDGKTLITGSYNLSDNAEHLTFENMMVLREAYSPLIQKYVAAFAKLWAQGGDGALLAALKDKVAHASTIPLVFDAMALDWQQVTDLKQLIVANCPQVLSPEYRANAAAHTTCPRQQ